MNKKYLILTSISILAFTGCFSGKTYVHPNYSPQKWAMDKAECNAFARGAYGYNQPHQIQDNTPKQYNFSGSSYNNYGGSTNYYGTVREQYNYNQGINNIAKGIANVRYQNNVNEAFEACLFQKGWSLQESSSSNSKSTIDSNDYDKDGFHISGWNRDGIYKKTMTKYNEFGYDEDGFDKDGFDSHGFNRNGIYKSTGTKYDEDGYDINGFNNKGTHISKLNNVENKYDKDGFDKDGYNKDGFDWDGYNKDGYDKNGIHMSEKFNK